MSYQPPPPAHGYAPPKSQPTGSKTVIFVILGVVFVVGFCFILILAALLIPAVMTAREAAVRQQSLNNLRMIGIALHSYHDTYKSLPAAFVPDADGNPRTSWRTSLLPFVEQAPLFDKYDFHTAWDDPRNSVVRQNSIPVYQSPRGNDFGTNRTSYVVVTSQQHEGNAESPMRTVFPGGRWIGMSSIIDGTSNTVAVVEIKNSNIEWAEPRDIDIDSISTDPNAPNSVDLAGGALVLFADGSAQTLAPGMSLETFKALLSRLDGQPTSY